MDGVLVAFFAFLQVVVVTLGAFYVPKIRRNTKIATLQNDQLLYFQEKQVELLEQMLDSNGKTKHLA